jgi:hypothetical protein
MAAHKRTPEPPAGPVKAPTNQRWRTASCDGGRFCGPIRLMGNLTWQLVGLGTGPGWPRSWSYCVKQTKERWKAAAVPLPRPVVHGLSGNVQILKARNINIYVLEGKTVRHLHLHRKSSEEYSNASCQSAWVTGKPVCLWLMFVLSPEPVFFGMVASFQDLFTFFLDDSVSDSVFAQNFLTSCFWAIFW